MDWNEFRSHIRHLSTQDQECVENAFRLGKEAHAGQLRKSGEPYFTHPIAVTKLLADMHADASTLATALLHDTIEDTDFSLHDIEQSLDHSCGKEVVVLIDGLTKLPPEDFEESPTLEEPIETIRKIFSAMEQDVRIIVIKLVDRLHNMQTIEHLSPERQQSFARETLDVYAKVADRLCMQDVRDELEALSLSVLDADAFSAMKEYRQKYEVRGKAATELLHETLVHSHEALMQHIAITYEHKSWEHLRTQTELQGSVVSGLSLITAAFICPTEDECYQLLGAIHQHWRREILSFRDFINAPATNGYQGIHTTILLEDGTRVRCKIRTNEMNEYAHKGIATQCFDNEAKGLMEYLSWGAHLSPLAEDTARRSADFWESLQNDILGETISIYGTGGDIMEVPEDSTALDGVFYYFDSEALRTKTIRVNGQEVHMQAPLKNGDSLEIDRSRQRTVDRSWLEWVHTGVAKAKIRSALGEHPDSKNMEIGKQLLQRVLTSKKKGFIEEFDEVKLSAMLQTLGYGKLADVFAAIGDGHLDPHEVYEVLQSKKTHQKKYPTIVSFSFPIETPERLGRLVPITHTYGINLRTVRMRRMSPTQIRIQARCKLSLPEERRIVRDLNKAGARDIELSTSRSGSKFIAGILLLLCLWGLDPVIARHILAGPMSALDLTLMRFVIFFAGAAIIYTVHSLTFTKEYKPLPYIHPILLYSGITMILTAIATYLALTYIPPTQYILTILAGPLVLSVYNSSSYFRTRMASSIALVALVFGLTILIWQQGTSSIGMVFAGLSSTGFALYSLVSMYYQQDKQPIQARYAAFIFRVALVTFPLSLFLLPFTELTQIAPTELAVAAGYVLLFSLLPYGLYYALLLRRDIAVLGPLLLFTAVPTALAETIGSGNVLPLIAIPVALMLFLLERHSVHTS